MLSVLPPSPGVAAPTVIRTRATRSSTMSYASSIEYDQGAVEIVVYNRAILLFFTDSEAVKRIHEVCCRLDDLATRHRRA